MNISYKGYNTKFLTAMGEGVEVGDCVKLNDSGLLVCAGLNENFIGVAVSNRENVIGMQEQGYIEMPYTGTVPTYGYCKLVSLGNGAVKVGIGDNDRVYKVMMVDKESSTVGFML